MFLTTAILFSLMAADTASKTGAVQNDGQIDQVIEAWRSRSEAFTEGVVEWDYIPESFGRFESYWVPENGDPTSRISASFEISASDAHYRSASLEFPILGQKEPIAREYFRSALLSHFQHKGSDRRKVLEYSITISADQLLHRWQDRGTEQQLYPRILLLPQDTMTAVIPLAKACGFAADSHDHESGLPSSVLHQLNTLPLLLSLRPFLFDHRLSGAMDDVEFQQNATGFGGSWVSLTLPPDKSVEGDLRWQLFLEPIMDYSVMRMLGSIGDKTMVQCDVSYDEHERGHWLPSEWTIQIIGDDLSYVRQIVRAKLTRIDRAEEGSLLPSTLVKTAHAPNTWVNDQISNKQSLVLDDGSLWDIPATHAGWLSHEQILERSRETEMKPAVVSIPWWNRRRLMSNLTQWPGLIIPLSILGTGMFLAIRFLSPRKKSNANPIPSSGEGQC